MDWEIVVGTLKQLGNNKFKNANEWSTKSGYYETVKENRLVGEVLMCLAAALSSGLTEKTSGHNPDTSSVVCGQPERPSAPVS